MKKGIACMLALLLLFSGTAFARPEPTPQPTATPTPPYNIAEKTAATKVYYSLPTHSYTWTLPATLRYMEMENRVTGDKIKDEYFDENGVIKTENAADAQKDLHVWGDITVNSFFDDNGEGDELVISVSSKRDFKLKNAHPIVKNSTDEKLLLGQTYSYDLFVSEVTLDAESKEVVSLAKKINRASNLVPDSSTKYLIAKYTDDDQPQNDTATLRLQYCITEGLVRSAIGDYKDTLTFYVESVAPTT